MVSYEGYMQIRILHKQGKSLRAIACEVGCSVNTVRKYLATEDAPTFRPAATPRESILKPFEAYLRERIAPAGPGSSPRPGLRGRVPQAQRSESVRLRGHSRL